MIIAGIVGLTLGIVLSVVIYYFPIVGVVIIVGMLLMTFIGWILDCIEGEKNNQCPKVYNSLPYMEEEDYDDFLTDSDSYLEDWNN